MDTGGWEQGPALPPPVSDVSVGSEEPAGCSSGVTQTLRGTHRWASPQGSHGEVAGEGRQVCVGGDKQLPCIRLTAIRAHPEACGPRNQT